MATRNNLLRPYDEQIARISEWCQRNNKRIHIPTRGPIRIEDKGTMSYEGYQEYLCAKGHYVVRGAFADEPEYCPRCGGDIAYRHSIDVTNGVEEDDPSTMPAPKDQIGSEDDWQKDHYGNPYALDIPLYQPLEQWRPYRLGNRDDEAS